MKLDLMNNRFPIKKPPRTYDSTEDYNYAESDFIANMKKSRRGKFLSDDKIADVDLKWIPAVYNPAHTHRGDIMEMSKKVEELPLNPIKPERPLNFYDLRHNKTAVVYETCKERVDTKAMNVVLDRVHDIPSLTIEGAISDGNIIGAPWSSMTSEREPKPHINTPAGPGYYDVTKWETGSQGIKVPVARLDIGPPKDSDDLSMVSSTPSPTAYFDDISFKPHGSLAPMDTSPRFRQMYRRERHVRFTGLLLSPDWDHKQSWDKPCASLEIGAKVPDPKQIGYYSYIIVPDTMRKASVKTSVAKSPLKYHSTFKYA